MQLDGTLYLAFYLISCTAAGSAENQNQFPALIFTGEVNFLISPFLFYPQLSYRFSPLGFCGADPPPVIPCTTNFDSLFSCSSTPPAFVLISSLNPNHWIMCMARILLCIRGMRFCLGKC